MSCFVEVHGVLSGGLAAELDTNEDNKFSWAEIAHFIHKCVPFSRRSARCHSTRAMYIRPCFAEMVLRPAIQNRLGMLSADPHAVC